MDEPENLAYRDFDGLWKPFVVTEIKKKWNLGGITLSLPGRPCADHLWQISDELWIIRANIIDRFDYCHARLADERWFMRIWPKDAAQLLILAGLPLDESLMPYATPMKLDAKHEERVESRNRPGRPPDTDARRDRKIAEAWASGHYRKYAELETAMELKKGQVKTAIDRHRKREERARG